MIYYNTLEYEPPYESILQIEPNPYIINELDQAVLYFSAQKQGGGKARSNKGKDWIKRGGSCRTKAKAKLKRKKKRWSR